MPHRKVSKDKVTPTSDQYSLAITYAEFRTGRLPFDETMTPYQVMEAPRDAEPRFQPAAGTGAAGCRAGDGKQSGRSLAIIVRHGAGPASRRGENRRVAAAPWRGGLHRRPDAKPFAHGSAEAARYWFADANSGRSAQGNDASRRAHRHRTFSQKILRSRRETPIAPVPMWRKHR